MSVYFEGDPAVDSSRRHMERVLKAEAEVRPARKWPMILMAVGSGGLWALWRMAAKGSKVPAGPREGD
jgi:hypothetical protein